MVNMKQETWTCDRCKKEFGSAVEVQSDLWLRNGDDAVNYAELCSKCVKEISSFCRAGEKK